MGTKVGSPTAVVTQACRGGDLWQVGGGPSGVRGDIGGATLGTWSQRGDNGLVVPTGGT